MRHIKNLNDLNMILESKIKKAMILTKDIVHRILLLKISAYYNEPVFDGNNEPLAYDRTLTLLNSVESSIILGKDSIGFIVGFDDEYLEYQYRGWKTQFGRGVTGVNQATGEDVLRYLNSGRHGGNAFKGSHNYWDEVIEEINHKYGGATSLFILNCQKSGLLIK